MIYFIAADSLVKIGYTNGPILTRIKALQTANPIQLELLHVIEGDRSVEQALHRHYQYCRTKGEWFRFSDEEIDLLKKGRSLATILTPHELDRL